MSALLNGVLASPESLSQGMSALESVATIVALVIGGVWTFRLFVRNRVDKPRATPSHAISIVDLGPEGLLLHVSVQVQNGSAVMLRLTSGEIRLAPILPLPDDATPLLDEFRASERTGATEINWPGCQRIVFDWSKRPREVEPGESDTYHFDFVVSSGLKEFEVYSYFQNVAKIGRSIGWSTTTLHHVESEASGAETTATSKANA
jgi:hypothetical protein